MKAFFKDNNKIIINSMDYTEALVGKQFLDELKGKNLKVEQRNDINDDFDGLVLTVGDEKDINLQEKDITITENKEEIITADEDYDGLSKVKITTNIPSIITEPITTNITKNGSTSLIPEEGKAFNEVTINTNVPSEVKSQTLNETITVNDTYSFFPDTGFNSFDHVELDVNVPEANIQEYKEIEFTENGSYNIIPDSGYDAIKTTDVTINVPQQGGGIDLTTGIKFGNSSFVTLPTEIIDANWQQITNANSMFITCYMLETLYLIDTSNIQDMSNFCDQCYHLINVPQLNTTNVANMQYAFESCNSLSNESLNNIMAMCYNASNITSNKFLTYLGLTYSQIEVCKSLSNFNTFTQAGWVTGIDNILWDIDLDSLINSSDYQVTRTPDPALVYALTNNLDSNLTLNFISYPERKTFINAGMANYVDMSDVIQPGDSLTFNINLTYDSDNTPVVWFNNISYNVSLPTVDITISDGDLTDLQSLNDINLGTNSSFDNLLGDQEFELNINAESQTIQGTVNTDQWFASYDGSLQFQINYNSDEPRTYYTEYIIYDNGTKIIQDLDLILHNQSANIGQNPALDKLANTESFMFTLEDSQSKHSSITSPITNNYFSNYRLTFNLSYDPSILEYSLTNINYFPNFFIDLPFNELESTSYLEINSLSSLNDSDENYDYLINLINNQNPFNLTIYDSNGSGDQSYLSYVSENHASYGDLPDNHSLAFDLGYDSNESTVFLDNIDYSSTTTSYSIEFTGDPAEYLYEGNSYSTGSTITEDSGTNITLTLTDGAINHINVTMSGTDITDQAVDTSNDTINFTIENDVYIDYSNPPVYYRVNFSGGNANTYSYNGNTYTSGSYVDVEDGGTVIISLTDGDLSYVTVTDSIGQDITQDVVDYNNNTINIDPIVEDITINCKDVYDITYNIKNGVTLSNQQATVNDNASYVTNVSGIVAAGSDPTSDVAILMNLFDVTNEYFTYDTDTDSGDITIPNVVGDVEIEIV